MTMCFYTPAADVDKAYARALAAGAKSKMPPTDMFYDDRQCSVSSNTTLNFIHTDKFSLEKIQVISETRALLHHSIRYHTISYHTHIVPHSYHTTSYHTMLIHLLFLHVPLCDIDM